MIQVTKDQHFVPQFYLELFADNGTIQVLDLPARRIGKPRPYQSVCYKPFFYGQQTGIQDEVSQHAESLFGALESQIAERLPRIIEHARLEQLSNPDLDTLAYMMALQLMRTERFRDVVQKLESQMLKFVSTTMAHFPGFTEDARRLAKEHGKEMSEEEAKQLQEFLARGEYTLTTDNTSHMRFIAGGDNLVGFHNLFFFKQWNILKATGQFCFVTSDNPVSEWLPSNGLYGNSFLERRHYFSLTPDIMIESVNPTRDDKSQSPAETVQYRTCTEDDVLVYDMVIAQHAKQFLYGKGKTEFQQLLWQSHKPGKAYEDFHRTYVLRQDADVTDPSESN